MPRTFLVNLHYFSQSASTYSHFAFLAAVSVGSDTESVAGDVTPSKADPSTQADQELADAVNDNAGEEEEQEEDDDDDDDDEADGEVYVWLRFCHI